jgi:hypothetical protein
MATVVLQSPVKGTRRGYDHHGARESSSSVAKTPLFPLQWHVLGRLVNLPKNLARSGESEEGCSH